MKILDTSNFCWINLSHGDRKMILFQRTECNPHKNTSMEVQKFIPYTLYENIKWFESFFFGQRKEESKWMNFNWKKRKDFEIFEISFVKKKRLVTIYPIF